MKKLILVSVLIAVFSLNLISQNTSQDFKTQNVSIFKNGTAFFQKKLQVNIEKEKSVFAKLPFAVNDVIFGSILFEAPGNNISKVGSYSKQTSSNHIANDILSMLKANISKTMTLEVIPTTEGGSLGAENTKITGKIVSVQKDLLLMKTNKGWFSTNPSNVCQMFFEDKPLTSYKKDITSKVIKLSFEKSKKNQQVNLTYMQKGLTWVPNYYITIIGKNKAKLILKANVLNDIENLENVNVNFVVGVPSFEFSHVKSPLSSFDGVSTFMSSLNGNRSFRSSRFDNISNSITTQQMSNYSFSNTSSSESVLTGKGSSDEGLFYYNNKNVNLAKGERAFFELINNEINYEQIYSVDLKENTNIYSSRYSRSKTTNKVWHSLRFKNNTKTPFTTGVVFVMRKEGGNYKPVSQNYLYYTPSGVTTTVKTTISPDIAVTADEKEISRKSKALKYHDLITVQAKIHVENFKNKDIVLEIKRLITGELIKSSDKYNNVSKLKSWNSKNKQNETIWSVNLKANEKKTISYTYKIYVSR